MDKIILSIASSLLLRRERKRPFLLNCGHETILKILKKKQPVQEQQPGVDSIFNDLKMIL